MRIRQLLLTGWILSGMACSGLFEPPHGSISGTWVRRFPGEEPATWWPFPPTWTLEVTEDYDGVVSGTITKQEYWNIDPPPPDLPPLPPQIWTVKGTRDGSKVRLTFDDDGAVRQYFEGKHVSPNLMEGFISRQEGAELRAAVEFVRHPDPVPGSVIAG